ncbi:hypothetical protein MMC21_002027 [Puttea exsequens]|nr:hypothetical protein [Puttea exsequens]
MPIIKPNTTTPYIPSPAATKLAIALHKSLGFTTFLLTYPANFLYDFLRVFIELVSIHALVVLVPTGLFAAFVLILMSLSDMRRIRNGRCLKSRELADELYAHFFYHVTLDYDAAPLDGFWSSGVSDLDAK